MKDLILNENAFEIACEWYNDEKTTEKEKRLLESMFSGLKEENISQLLTKVVRHFINNPDIPYNERDEVSKKIVPYLAELGERSKVWTDRDQIYMDCTINAVKSEATREHSYVDDDTTRDIEEWLNELKNRVQEKSHWKPTEKQIEYLKEFFTACEEEWGYDESEGWEILEGLKTLI